MHGGKVALARLLIGAARDAVDDGDLDDARRRLEHARRLVEAADETEVARELRLTIELEASSQCQHRGAFDAAEELAEAAVAFAREGFGVGIQEARALLRLYYTWEAQRRYVAAQSANEALAARLAGPGTAPLRLTALTRALACAVKNTDRDAQDRFEAEGKRIVAELRVVEGRDHLAWFFYWRSLMWGHRAARPRAQRFLHYADGLLSPNGANTRRWRWHIAFELAMANLLQITPGREAEGRERLASVRAAANASGYLGLVHSIDEAFNHLDWQADNQ